MSEAQRAMTSTVDATKDDHDFVAGVASLQTQKNPSNFAWPVPEISKRVADYSNVHTEYRDNYPKWQSEKVPTPLSSFLWNRFLISHQTQPFHPSSTNPITSGVVDDSDSGAWLSETRQAMEDAKRFGERAEVIAGASSSQLETAPPNFSWPVPELPRHTPDYQNVHTEYRDNFPGWNSEKVFILYLSLSQLISNPSR